MDPLSLTVSILTLVGLSSQCVKVLKSIVLRKSARRLVVDLDDELSELRRDVFAIQELFLRRSKELTSCGDSVTLGDETIGSVVGCLEKVNALVIELHRLLSPLLELYLRSDCVTIQKLMRWPKDQSKLNDIKKDLYNVRIMLNTKLGILDWGTSLRLEAMAHAQRNDLMKIQETQARSDQCCEQYMKRLETFIEPIAQMLSNQQQKLVGSSPDEPARELSSEAKNKGDMGTSIAASSIKMCQCCCHYKYLNRSPRVVDRIFGTLFTVYSGVSNAAPRCTVSGCAQSCSGPDIALSLTYLFPPWLLSWGISLKFTQATGGFNHNFRVIQCVEYSSPIFRCAYEGDVSRMKALLKGRFGSPFDVTHEPRRSLLRVAASRGHGEICDILLYEGADPFLVDHENKSAVEIAWEAVLTTNKRAQKLGKLIALSSSEHYLSKFKMGLLHRCVLDLTRLELKDLLESIPTHTIDEKDAGGQTPLYWAARRGNLHAVSLLLDAGADQNSKNNRGSNILIAAIMSGNSECIWKILHSGCDVHLPQPDGYTPLHYCCRYDTDLSITKHILLGGSSDLLNLNAQTALGHTPLMLATFNTHPHLTQFLINHNAALNMQAKDGATALHFAVMAGDCASVRHLLGHGADCSSKVKRGARNGNKNRNDGTGEGLLDLLKRRRGDCEMVRTFLDVDVDSLGGLSVEDHSTKEGKGFIAEGRNIKTNNDDTTTSENENENKNDNNDNEKRRRVGCDETAVDDGDDADAEWSALFTELMAKIRAGGRGGGQKGGEGEKGRRGEGECVYDVNGPE